MGTEEVFAGGATREILGRCARLTVCKTMLPPGPERSVPAESLTVMFSVNAAPTALLGFAIADLDHFKVLNDTFGHQCGDCMLTEVASRSRDRLRAYDPCAGHSHRATVSIGVANGASDGLPHHVVKRADGALYDSKVAGRDGVRRRGLNEPLSAESHQENPRASRIRRPGSASGR